MKITILALHLGFGGIEKYIITIANILSEKFDVEIVSTYKTTEQPSFPVNSNVKIVYLTQGIQPNGSTFKEAIKNKNIMMIVKEGAQSIKILRKKFLVNKGAIQSCNSDIIISTRDFHNEMIQKYANKSIIKITSEHNHPCGNQNYIDRVVNSCVGFDYMLPISQELTMFYKILLPKVEVRYIPFCIDQPTTDERPTFDSPVYVSVGRLSPEKGILELIDIFASIVSKQKDAILHLVGDGELMPQVLNKIKLMQLDNNIIVHGFLKKPAIDKLYVQSRIFLMASHTESFGFVLLEAMACGIPCIAFDSAQGANEIIQNDCNGYLIKDRDTQQYVDKVLCISNNKTKLKQLSEYAVKCLETYSYGNTKQQWLSLMSEVKEKHSIK